MTIEIIPTVVPQNLADVAMFAQKCRTFSQTFHVDAADGTLAPNTAWIPSAGEKLPDSDSIFYEAHLMVRRPESAGLAFAAAGARRIIAHVEAFDSADEAQRAFASWRKSGAKEIGVAALIETPLEALEAYTLLCESVTLLSIASIGVQGIPFDERGYGRVADLHARYPDLAIEVDGGVGQVQIAALARAGARRFSVGSAISRSADPSAAYQTLQTIAESAIQ